MHHFSFWMDIAQRLHRDYLVTHAPTQSCICED